MWSSRLHLASATIQGRGNQHASLLGDELRAMRALKREAKSPLSSLTGSVAPPSRFPAWPSLIERGCTTAKIPFPVHATCCATPAATPGKQGTDTRTLQALPRPPQHPIDMRYTSWRRAGSRTSGVSPQAQLGVIPPPRLTHHGLP